MLFTRCRDVIASARRHTRQHSCTLNHAVNGLLKNAKLTHALSHMQQRKHIIDNKEVEAKPAVPKTQGVAAQPNRKLFVGGTVCYWRGLHTVPLAPTRAVPVVYNPLPGVHDLGGILVSKREPFPLRWACPGSHEVLCARHSLAAKRLPLPI